MVKEKKSKEGGDFVGEKTLDIKKQIERENRQLKIFFIGIGVLIILLLFGAFIINNIRNFEHKGITFNVVKEKNLVFYETSFPVIYEGEKTNYNIYLRNDPRKLEEEVPFNGELIFMQNMIINMSGDESGFNCDGDGIIGIANLLKPLNLIGMEVTKNENATCNLFPEYMFVQIQPGEVTKIEQDGVACYTMYVKDCEILKATERFMVETFEKINKEWI